MKLITLVLFILFQFFSFSSCSTTPITPPIITRKTIPLCNTTVDVVTLTQKLGFNDMFLKKE